MKRAIVLVDHGSRLPEANAVVEELATLLAARLPDCLVRAAHMELAEPSLGAAISACVAAGVDEIVVHPYFLAPGSHSTRDIPRLVEEALSAHPGVRARVTEPLGVHPKLVDVILERIEGADTRRPPRRR